MLCCPAISHLHQGFQRIIGAALYQHASNARPPPSTGNLRSMNRISALSKSFERSALALKDVTGPAPVCLAGKQVSGRCRQNHILKQLDFLKFYYLIYFLETLFPPPPPPYKLLPSLQREEDADEFIYQACCLPLSAAYPGHLRLLQDTGKFLTRCQTV